MNNFFFSLSPSFSIETVFQAASRQADNLTWERITEHSILIEYQLSFDVNFSNGILLTHRKTKMMHFDCFFSISSVIYDIIMESQQFECSNFKLNPVLRMAIMRKVNLINFY